MSQNLNAHMPPSADPKAEGGRPSVSLVIPCHNARGKIGRCLASLRRIDLPPEDYEVLFIDDRSSDGSFEALEAQCAQEPNWRLLRMEANSGSPSGPRNLGARAARGAYLFYLDCDDEILPDALRVHLERARQTRADIVRGYLLAETGEGRRAMNRLTAWSEALSKAERIKLMIGKQSSTVCSLIRAELLREAGLSWREDLRMGEDTLFLASVLAAAERIEYVDHPTYVYVKTPGFTPSSTQSYGARELRDHLEVWRGATRLLRPLGLDYVALRLQVGLTTALRSMIFLNRGDVGPELVAEFAAFLEENAQAVAKFSLSPRHLELVELARAGSFEAFRAACRPRLVIAGYDLKFIQSLIPRLEEFYEIRLDLWTGHDRHHEAASRAALDWAELIWCEWLLGNAVWHARHKKPHQILIARMHRFELERAFGDRIEADKLDAVVAVSTLFLERLLERFPAIPRRKARLLQNFVDSDAYVQVQGEERRFRLGMIGVLPSRKGLARGLSVLARLRREDPRYALDVYGKAPQELAWLANDPQEMAYYQACSAYIAREGLAEAVRFRGHVDIRSALACDGVGVVLSLSDSEQDVTERGLTKDAGEAVGRSFPGPESFHLAVADAFAAGGVGLIRAWEGADFIWPARFILPDEAAIVARILSWREAPQAYLDEARAGADFVRERYGVEKFLQGFRALFRQAL